MFIPFLLVGTFVCLFPIMLYCLALAGINNRPRPTRVDGSWDLAWAILATVGFWIIGGPSILIGLHDLGRRLMLRGSFETIREYYSWTNWPWGLLWTAYFMGVTAGAALLLWWRRSVVIVYHIEPARALSAVEAALADSGSLWARIPRGYSVSAAEAAPTEATNGSAIAQGPAHLDVSVAPNLHTMTIRWPQGWALRQSFIASLDRNLMTVPSGENPVVGWLLTAATILFAMLLFCVTLFVVFVWNLPR